MSDSHSTTPKTSGKPPKPCADFPLFPYATRRWAKKIKGKLYYFGRWDQPESAWRADQAFRAQARVGRGTFTPRLSLH